MESEYQILSYLQDNELTSHRKISKRTGLSLGAVNILIIKMARKGLIKVEKLNPRTAATIYGCHNWVFLPIKARLLCS